MSYAPLASAVDLTKFQVGDASAILEQVGGAIRGYCDWHVAPSVAETLTIDGQGSRHIWLPSLHVTAVSGVKVHGESVEFDWSETGFLELLTGQTPYRPRAIEVTFTHGHTAVPPEVVEVLVSVANRAISSPTGATREQAGAVSFNWATVAQGVSGGIALLAHEREILDVYKLPKRP